MSAFRGGLFLIVGLLLALSPQDGSAIDKAFLVGISEYLPEDAPTRGGQEDPRQFNNLAGPTNDVAAMIAVLEDRYGLEDGDIVSLLDQRATRNAILEGIVDELVVEAAPGKRFLFYFAGHGSQVRVSSPDAPDELVETIVPADAWQGAQDIPDKSLRQLFNRVVDAGAELVIIMDSCHSGGATRGEVVRSMATISQPIDLPDDPGPPLEERGVLQLLAAQASQPAREISADGAPPMGAFTSIFVRELRAAPLDEPAQALMDRVRGMLVAYRFYQRPVILGSTERRRQPIFPMDDELKAREAELPQVMVTEYEGSSRVRVAAGPDRGLYMGSILQLESDDSAPVNLEVVETPDLASSIARFVDQPDVLPKLPNWADVHRLSAPPIPPLGVWLPGDSANRSNDPQRGKSETVQRLEQSIADTKGLIQVNCPADADLVLEAEQGSDSGACLKWRIAEPRGLLSLLSPLEVPCHAASSGFVELESELLRIWRVVSLDTLRASPSPRNFPWRLVSSEIDCGDSVSADDSVEETCHDLRLEADDPEDLNTRLMLSGGKRFLYAWSIDNHLEIHQLCPNTRTRGCPEPPVPYGEVHPVIPLFQFATNRPMVLFGIISSTPVNEGFMNPKRSRDSMERIGFELGDTVFEGSGTRSSDRPRAWHTEVIPVGLSEATGVTAKK